MNYLAKLLVCVHVDQCRHSIHQLPVFNSSTGVHEIIWKCGKSTAPKWWKTGFSFFYVEQVALPEVDIEHLYQAALKQLHTNHTTYRLHSQSTDVHWETQWSGTSLAHTTHLCLHFHYVHCISLFGSGYISKLLYCNKTIHHHHHHYLYIPTPFWVLPPPKI